MLIRKDAGVVDRGGLENRCTLTGTKGSNPFLSAFYIVATILIPLSECFSLSRFYTFSFDPFACLLRLYQETR